ncbi:hypothetical protein [Mesorhizobium sp. IMUNJ 23232]|uniref:hypothetical protein n=1 Tax=Mesorhizobium sp. IMUNJ 23232 TaxID=3376064 RepID=UPI0037AA4603
MRRDKALMNAEWTPQRIEQRQAQAARSGGAQGRGPPGGCGTPEIVPRQGDGDSKTAQQRLRVFWFRFSRAQRRQGYGQAPRRHDDQPSRRCFGRMQQLAYGAMEVAGKGEYRRKCRGQFYPV